MIRLSSYILLSAFVVWLISPAAFAQQSAPTASTAEASATGDSTAPRERIVDKPMRPGVGKQIARIPLLPFVGAGKAMEKGLTVVEEQHLQERMNYTRWKLREHHTEVMTGGLGPGSGTAFGVRFFDDDFFHPAVRADLPLWISTRNYQQFEALVGIRPGEKRRFFFEVGAKYRSRPEEQFFGVGPGASHNNEAEYQLDDRSAAFAIGSEFATGGRANVAGGDDPSAVLSGLPGLARGSSLLRYGFSLSQPWLDNRLDPHRGVRLRGRFLWVESLNSDPFDFFEYGASSEIYIPLGAPRTLVIRGVGEFRRPRDGGTVPFYSLAFLGGRSTLRGFEAYRFADRNAVLFNLEYRYRIWRRADFVLFTDHGQVAPRIAAFGLGKFAHAGGFGIRFKDALGATALRLDVGFSREGARLSINFAPEF
jgi:outer membrane protein assembly factor BamA